MHVQRKRESDPSYLRLIRNAVFALYYWADHTYNAFNTPSAVCGSSEQQVAHLFLKTLFGKYESHPRESDRTTVFEDVSFQQRVCFGFYFWPFLLPCPGKIPTIIVRDAETARRYNMDDFAKPSELRRLCRAVKKKGGERS